MPDVKLFAQVVAKFASGITFVKFTRKFPFALLVTLETLKEALMVGGVVVPSKFTHARHSVPICVPFALNVGAVLAAPESIVAAVKVPAMICP